MLLSFKINLYSYSYICIWGYVIVFYTNLTHLLNKQTGFFDKNVSIEPQFYNYPTTVLPTSNNMVVIEQLNPFI